MPGGDGIQACEAWLSNLMVHSRVGSGIVGKGWNVRLSGSGRSSTCSVGCGRHGRGKSSDGGLCTCGGEAQRVEGGVGLAVRWWSGVDLYMLLRARISGSGVALPFLAFVSSSNNLREAQAQRQSLTNTS